MQQQHLRAPQNNGLNLTSNSGKEQQAKSRSAIVDSQLDAPSWNASQAIWWFCRGWWNSTLWWALFAGVILIWCLAYAKADDGSEFSSALQFLSYFFRVRFCKHNLIHQQIISHLMSGPRFLPALPPCAL